MEERRRVSRLAYSCSAAGRREKERVEAEERLQRELGRLRDQARQELEHSRTHSRELYERENR